MQNKHYFAGGRREGKSREKDDSKENELIHDLQPEQKNYPNIGSYTYTHTKPHTQNHIREGKTMKTLQFLVTGAIKEFNH